VKTENWLSSPSTNHTQKKNNKQTSKYLLDKERCTCIFKEQIYFCKVWSCTTKTNSVSRCESLEIRLDTVKWVADSEETRQVYSTEIPSNIATIRGELDGNWLTFYLKLYREWHTRLRSITAPSYEQPNKLSQLQKIQLNLLTATFLAI